MHHIAIFLGVGAASLGISNGAAALYVHKLPVPRMNRRKRKIRLPS
jgi:hypothetical protein